MAGFIVGRRINETLKRVTDTLILSLAKEFIMIIFLFIIKINKTMKRILTLVLYIVTFQAISQNYYSDKTHIPLIKIESIENEPDLVSKANMHIGYYKFEGTYITGGSFYLPKYFTLNFLSGQDQTFYVDGSIYFYSWIKRKKGSMFGYYDLGVKRSYSFHKTTTFDKSKRKAIGVHFGGGKSIFNADSAYDNVFTLKSNSLFVGITYMSASNVKAKRVYGNTVIRNQNLTYFHFDVINYTNKELIDIDYLDEELTNGLTSVEIDDAILNEYTRDTSFRFYITRKSLFKATKTNFSLNYMLGIKEDITNKDELLYIYGLGIGYNFL